MLRNAAALWNFGGEKIKEVKDRVCPKGWVFSQESCNTEVRRSVI